MNKKYHLFLLSLLFLIFFIFLTWLIIASTSKGSDASEIPYLSVGTFLTFALLIFTLFQIYFINNNFNRHVYVKKSFNSFLDFAITNNYLGIIVVSHDNKVIWNSSFVNKIFGEKVIGKRISNLLPELVDQDAYNSEKIVTKINDSYYLLQNFSDKNIITIKDVTKEEIIQHSYRSEKLALGEMEIDNFKLYQSTLSEEDVFQIQSIVVDLLEKISTNYNFSYRQYVGGKFLIITNDETIEKMVKDEFVFLNMLDEMQSVKNVRISISFGFAKGLYQVSELIEVSKNALRQSQSRGGDQITIFEKNKKPVFFGSRSEIALDLSKTRIKDMTRIIEQKLSSEKIKKVIIYGHKFSDLDSLGSAFALAKIASQFDKKAYIQNITFDETSKRAISTYIAGNDSQLFIKPSVANNLSDESTLVFVVDTAEKIRIENPQAFAKVHKDNVIILDHHRVSENPDFSNLFNQYIETNASSASEIVTEIINFINRDIKIEPNVAQMLLNGIYMDTNQFQKSTSSRTFNAAALLESWGALSSESVEFLKISEEISLKVKSLIENIREIKPGYFLAYSSIEASGDIISIAADEMLKIQGRKASFVVAKNSGTEEYKLSARGIKTNVQVIAEAVGGGGHYAAAAASSVEPLEQFVDNIIQAIVSVKNNEINTN